jgi:flavin-dependent dehydrogenase
MWKGLIGLDWGIPGGYAWVFPKKDCVAIGAGSSFHEAKKLRPYTLDIIRKYGLGTLDGQIVRGQLMPVRKSGTPVSNGRVALVGDAAGMIDPLSGEGIYYALRSAYLAADAINGFLAGKSADLKSYDTAVIRELGPELKIARTIQKMNSAVPQVFFHYLTESDRFWRAFCQMLRGERTYVGLKKRLPWPVRILFKIM